MLNNYIKDISIPVNKILFENYGHLNLNETSFVILMRIMEYSKYSDALPALETLQEGTTLSKSDIPRIIQSLIESDLLALETSKVNDKYMETVSFEPLYQKLIALTDQKPSKPEPDKEAIKSLFSYIENLYGRVLNPNEFERMNSWLNDSQYPPGQIEEAVDLAYKNQVTSLSYVERILQNMSKSENKEGTEMTQEKRPPFKNWLKGD
jgi:DNA replication protein